jgi:tRNA(fMet)-specific endonuclease VapC
MIVVLDTNTYSNWRRNEHWNETISTADKIIIPAIVLGELRVGFLRGAKGRENERKLVHFLRRAVVEIGNVGNATSHHYAIFKNHLRDQGTPIPAADVWIAAVAAEHGGLLLTRDGHFENLPQVRIANIDHA